MSSETQTSLNILIAVSDSRYGFIRTTNKHALLIHQIVQTVNSLILVLSYLFIISLYEYSLWPSRIRQYPVLISYNGFLNLFFYFC